MYAFSLLSIPLTFLSISAWKFRGGGDTYRSFVRGLIFGVPVIFLWSLLRPVFAPRWGSILLPFSFLLRYWLVPLGLSVGAYGISAGFAGLTRGLDYERLVAFLFGSMTVVGIAQVVESWGLRDPAITLALPALVAASLLSVPYFIEEAVKDGMPYAVGHGAVIFGGLLVASLAASLFFLRLEWLGAIMTILFCTGSSMIGLQRLSRRR
jgi:hypothetical protein